MLFQIALFISLASLLAGAEIGPGDPGGRSAAATVKPAFTPEALKKKKRPGCRKFCQQAGGFGGGPPTTDPRPVSIFEQEIGGTRDRIIKVRATCQLDVDCVGAIVLTSRRVINFGRADLEIPAQTTSRVPVGITRKALASLKEHGADRKVSAAVPLVDETQSVSFSPLLTVLPPD